MFDQKWHRGTEKKYNNQEMSKRTKCGQDQKMSKVHTNEYILQMAKMPNTRGYDQELTEGTKVSKKAKPGIDTIKHHT